MAHFFQTNLKTPRFWKVFDMKPRCLDEASVENNYFYLGFLKVLDENVSKPMGFSRFFKFFELCIILGKNLANTKGFGTFFWKILKTPRFWKVFRMKRRCLDEVSIEKIYFYLGFLKVLDENVSKTIGFSSFLSYALFLAKTLQIPWVLAHFVGKS